MPKPISPLTITEIFSSATTIPRALGLYVVAALLGFVIASLTTSFFFPAQIGLYFAYLVQLILVAIFIPFILYRLRHSGADLNWWKSQINTALSPKMQLNILFRGWIFDLGFVFLLFGILGLFLSADSLAHYLSTPAPIFSSGTLLADICIAVVVAPILEELLFRGVVLHRLLVRWKTCPAILISSALFASLHIHEGMVPAFAFGILLSMVVIKTGSIMSSLYLHMIHNGVVSIIATIGTTTQSSKDISLSDVQGIISVSPELLIIGILGLTLGTYLILRVWQHPYWNMYEHIR